MGNATVKPLAAAVAAVKPAATRRCYSLRYVATASRFDGDSPSEEEMDEGLEQLGDPETWLPYLVSATRDALELPAKEEDPHLYGIGAAFTRCEAEPHSYRGIVAWNGPACDYERLKSSLDWFIGDRMSQYEIGDDNASWRMYIEVKELKEKAE